jgi:hypothetical protein
VVGGLLSTKKADRCAVHIDRISLAIVRDLGDEPSA